MLVAIKKIHDLVDIKAVMFYNIMNTIRSFNNFEDLIPRLLYNLVFMLLCQYLNWSSVFFPTCWLLLFVLIQSIDYILCTFTHFRCRFPNIDLSWLAVLLSSSLLNIFLNSFKRALFHVIWGFWLDLFERKFLQ